MAIRTLPFGYCISHGKVCVVEDEAEIVRRTFVGYAEGRSYDDLTRWLNGQSIPYLPGKSWNKNAVARSDSGSAGSAGARPGDGRDPFQ